MTYKIETAFAKIPKDAFSVLIFDEEKPLFDKVPEGAQFYAENFVSQKDDKGEQKKSLSFSYIEKDKIYFGWLVSTKSVKFYSKSEKFKIIAARACQKALASGKPAISFYLDSKDGAGFAADILEGVMLGSYSFDKYKTKNEKSAKKPEVIFFISKEDANAVRVNCEERTIVCEAVNNARDLCNDTSRVVTPENIGKLAKELAKKYKLVCTVYDEKRLIKEGYNGIVTVGRGSSNPPRMIVLEYNPSKKSKDHLFLIGKGLTFDSGGLCLKPHSGMWKMKCDMTGASAVLWAMTVFASLKIDAKITAIIPTAENAIGPDATYPNEVFKAKNGKFVHIENTDAEGRLAMTDAFGYAEEKGATHIIDVATLTGSIMVALGTSLDGIFSNDEEFAKMIVAAGEEVGESHHIMPLFEEYTELLSHSVADLNNISSSSYGGAITAALFLREFVAKGAKWAHMDIAGVDTADKQWKYYSQGATAIPLRTLVNFVKNYFVK